MMCIGVNLNIQILQHMEVPSSMGIRMHTLKIILLLVSGNKIFLSESEAKRRIVL